MDESGPVEIDGKGEFDPEKRFETPVKFGIAYKYANGVIVECSKISVSTCTCVLYRQNATSGRFSEVFRLLHFSVVADASCQA